MPDFTYEQAALDAGHDTIIGVDEVGRGPLAGPVTAAAVILDPANIPEGLDDSKKLSAKRRDVLSAQIHASARVSIAHVDVQQIDQMNILQAAHLAMVQAVAGLGATGFVLVDGNLLPKGLDLPAQAVIKGDSKSLSIAAASIVAKAARDAIMADLADQFPGYGWEKNAGYPSAAHKAALLRLGVTPHHRRSFKPIHNILYQEKLITS